MERMCLRCLVTGLAVAVAVQAVVLALSLNPATAEALLRLLSGVVVELQLPAPAGQ